MTLKQAAMVGSILLGGAGAAGCAAMWAGAGAAGAATAYEAHNKHELDDLKDDRSEGRINEQEYGTRKDEIEDRSLVY